MKYFITGGAGFIGSHFTDTLLASGKTVVVYDNFSTGRMDFLKHHRDNPNLTVIQGDLADNELLDKSISGSQSVFHLAAHADVQSGYFNRMIDHEQNLVHTKNLLEAMVKHSVKELIFSSTSSVYGDASIHPTPENYPFKPTSLYGATKAACESYIHAYSSYFSISSYIYRFASFIGERYTHGIIFDVLKKLERNHKKITLLSDGTPKKSSIYVQDGIQAVLLSREKCQSRYNVFNIGHDHTKTVAEIVQLILKYAESSDTKIEWSGKESNWKGDNEYVHLSNSKLKKIGWKPEISIEEGIKRTVTYLLQNQYLFKEVQ